MKKIFSTLAALLLLAGSAFAQSSPNLQTGQVPTAIQWNSYFTKKQDYLGAIPLLSTGGVMTGRLITAPSSTTLSGLNVTPGGVPGSPANGDVWMTTAGMFYQANGLTVGPLVSTSSPCLVCVVTNGPNTLTGRQTYIYTPVFDLAGGGLAANLLFSPALGLVIPAAATYNDIRFGQPGGGYNTYTIGAGATVAPIYSQVESLSGSNVSSNMYAGIFGVILDGNATAKAIHLEALANTGSTGAIIASNMQINPVSTSGYASGGFASLTSTGADNKAIGYGIESTGDSYICALCNQVNPLRMGTAFIRWVPDTANATDFLTLIDPSSTTHKRYSVDSFGNVHIGWAGQGFASTLQFGGSSSQFVTLQSQANAGNSALVLPTGSGTLGSNAASPISIDSVTGRISIAAIPNATLANSTISGVALGSNLFSLTFGTHLAAGGSSYNGSAAVTITSDATNANTVSTIVARDGSGNFSAGTITAALTGHASLDVAISSLGTNIQTGLTTTLNGTGALVGTTNPSIPVIYGGSAAGSSLTLASTSGAGTTDSIVFQTGSGTNRGSISTAGFHGIGPLASTIFLDVNPNANASSVSAPATGSLVRFAGGDSVNNVIDYDSFGGSMVQSFRRSDGTAAARTGLVANDVILNIQSAGWTSAAAYSGTAAAVQSIATETWSGTATGSMFKVRTTKNTTITPADALAVDGLGHFQLGSINPASVSSCGTGSLTANSTDSAGQATATGATACTVNFGNAFATAPSCVVNDNTTVAALKVATTTGGFTVTGLTSGDQFSWACFGKVGL